MDGSKESLRTTIPLPPVSTLFHIYIYSILMRHDFSVLTVSAIMVFFDHIFKRAVLPRSLMLASVVFFFVDVSSLYKCLS
jgi:hypothetical protein